VVSTNASTLGPQCDSRFSRPPVNERTGWPGEGRRPCRRRSPGRSGSGDLSAVSAVTPVLELSGVADLVSVAALDHDGGFYWFVVGGVEDTELPQHGDVIG
jgi:hypothetical protein